MIYKQSKTELETTINYCAADDLAEVYSADPVTIRKLDKLTEQFPDAYQLVHADRYGKSYKTSKRYVRFAKPASEARKAAARSNALTLHRERAYTHDPSTSNAEDE